MGNIFAELQMLSSSGISIPETRESLNSLVIFMKEFADQDQQIQFFANLRKLDVEVIKEADGFMVRDDIALNIIPVEFRHDSFGFVKNGRIIYSGRFVFPVKDVKGNVAGFVGYDKFEEPKYLDSKNYGYKAKEALLFGMENMREYYTSNHLFVTEGLICALWLRSQGFNAVSTLGSYLTPYMKMILKRFKGNLFMVPDSDETGTKYKMQIKRSLPLAHIIQCTYAKDIDDARQLNEAQVLEDLQSLVNNPYSRVTQFRR